MIETNFNDFEQLAESSAEAGIGRILNMDAAVDELDDFEVMDVWVRGTFARRLFRANSHLLPADELDRLETQLSECHAGVFKQIAIEYAGRDSDLASALTWSDDRENVRTLFERWTKDDVDNVVGIARQKIKTALRGCGMPDINIQRNRVQIYTE